MIMGIYYWSTSHPPTLRSFDPNKYENFVVLKVLSGVHHQPDLWQTFLISWFCDKELLPRNSWVSLCPSDLLQYVFSPNEGFVWQSVPISSQILLWKSDPVTAQTQYLFNEIEINFASGYFCLYQIFPRFLINLKIIFCPPLVSNPAWISSILPGTTNTCSKFHVS